MHGTGHLAWLTSVYDALKFATRRDATMFVGAIEALSDFVAPWKDDARIALWRRYGDPPPTSRMPTSRAAASRTPQKLKNETLMLPLLNIRMDLRGVLQGQGETE
jgi:hypothetical protein